MMSSSHSKDNRDTNTNNTSNNRDRKSRSLRLSQKLRGLSKDLKLRVSIDGKSQQRRDSIHGPSPREDQEYKIVHTPDRPERFVSPIEAPTEDDCYDAIRSWQRVAERERSGIYGTEQRTDVDRGSNDHNDDGNVS